MPVGDSLIKANLSGAVFYGADLRKADFKGADVDVVQLFGAKKLDKAVMPYGTVYKKSK